MKRVEARIESPIKRTAVANSIHMGRFWDPKSLPCAFDSFSIRSCSSLRAAIATVLGHYRCRQSADPLRLSWICSKQASRCGAKVVHGNPIPLWLVTKSLSETLLALHFQYFRTRNGSVIMIVGRCDCNLFLLWCTDSCRKYKTRDWRSRRILYTGCPPKKKRKKRSGTPDFHYFDIRKYSIILFWFHQIKHCLLKRMIPKSFDFVRQYWFYNHFLKHDPLRILLNLLKLFMAGIAVHKFSLCFVCTDHWVSGQQCMEIKKP